MPTDGNQGILAPHGRTVLKFQETRSSGRVDMDKSLEALATLLLAFNSPVHRQSGTHARHLPVANSFPRVSRQFTNRLKTQLGETWKRSGDPQAAATLKASSPLMKALKPTNGALAVSVEFSAPPGDPIADLPLRMLSKQMRTNNAAAVLTADLNAIGIFAAEQKKAKSDYPGPIPVIFTGDVAQAADAVNSGASAVVLDPKDLDRAKELDVEVLWHVSNADQVGPIVEAGHGDAFLAAGSAALDIMPALPEDSVLVASIDSMQANNTEVSTGRGLAAKGVKSLLLRDACVGDDEDLEYIRFAIGGIKSKASQTFRIGGLTGSTNGHYGTGIFKKDEVRQWDRTKASTE